MDMTPYILTFLIFMAALAGLIYAVGIAPSRLVEQWLATLANGERIPEKPRFGWRYWLYPLHRECLAVMKKMDEMRSGSEKIQTKLAQVEFLQNFVLGSLMEGVMVVDELHQITLVNSEFLALFHHSQSPLRRKVNDVMRDSKLDALIAAAFKSAQVEAGRITWQSQSSPEGGRPPAFEVSAIPVRISETRVGAVVVLFLPPPDRPRIVQVLKRHAEKLQRLVNDWTPNDRTLLHSSVADLFDIEAPTQRLGIKPARDADPTIKP